jgi:glycosyltransferase involved in cell wall biosynthesis
MPFFSRTSIFLMPCVKTAANDMDGIPVAMMEAMSCGMPVVSSDISGLPELIKHGYNGWMVPEKDVDALVEILKYLLQNHSELMKAGENAIKSVQTEFRIEENAQKLRGLISE